MTQPHTSVSAPRPDRSLRAQARRLRLLGGGLLLALTGACDHQGGPPSAPSDSSQAAAGAGTSGAAFVPSGQSALERVDPQDPERPFFHDFGELDFGAEVKWNATMRNTGSTPLAILGATPMCGCTRLTSFSIASADGEEVESVYDFKQRPEIAVVPPGGTITAQIDILSKHTKPNIPKLALVRLTTDSELTPFITFELHLFPQQPFDVAPSSFEMPRVPTSHGAGEKVKILVAAPGDPGIVHRILSSPEGIETRLETTHFAGETIWYVHVKVPPLTPMGAIRGKIVLAVSDREGNGDAGRLEIPVEIRVGPDIFLDPGMFAFGAVPKGLEKVLQAQLNGLVPGAKIGVTEVRVDGEDAEYFTLEKAVINPDDDGRSKIWQFQITMSEDHPTGYLASEMVIVLDEPFGGGAGEELNEVRARISGIVRE